jgi:putative hydrolase of the HAD superfamily
VGGCSKSPTTRQPAAFDGPQPPRYPLRVRLTHLLFDLDDTLYPPGLGVVARVDRRITAFMVERLGMTPEAANALRARYREAHGTTMHGLALHHRVEPDDYLACIHAVELDDLLAPDAALRAMLDRLPHEKSVFTNAPACHATRVLDRLGVRECFGAVFSLERLAYVPKPEPAAFAVVLEALDASPAGCLLVDDRADNLRTARGLGMRGVLVGAAAAPPDLEVDAAVASVLELERVLPATTRP